MKGNNCGMIPMFDQTVRELFLKLHGPTILANRQKHLVSAYIQSNFYRFGGHI